MNEPY